MVNCNFAQFFGNQADERAVIMFLDCYSQRFSVAVKASSDEVKLPNVFDNEDDFAYF